MCFITCKAFKDDLFWRSKKKLRRSIFFGAENFSFVASTHKYSGENGKVFEAMAAAASAASAATDFFLSFFVRYANLYFNILRHISAKVWGCWVAVENKRLIVVGGQQVFLLCSWMSSVELRLNTTVTVWSIKLSNFETGKYLDGRLLENSWWWIWASPTSCRFGQFFAVKMNEYIVIYTY